MPGEIILNPTEASLKAAKAKLATHRPARATLWPACNAWPRRRADGTTIDLLANLELPFELPMIAECGAHGIGLMRSEFLFMNRETFAGRGHAGAHLPGDRGSHGRATR